MKKGSLKNLNFPKCSSFEKTQQTKEPENRLLIFPLVRFAAASSYSNRKNEEKKTNDCYHEL